MALKGVRVIELAGLAPAPFCGLILADFGAEVVRIDRPDSPISDRLGRGKRSLALNLKQKEGRDILKKLVAQCDVLIEPYRPGVMERLGLGPVELLEINPKLIYARLTGFGQSGPLALRAGHDINYLAISGVLSLLGRKGENPIHPINLVADFAGGGAFCALGILLALLERSKSGKGQVIDAAMIDGAAYLSTFVYKSLGTYWKGPRGTNVLDTGSHFYETYKTKDGGYMAVGAIEPQFYAELLKGLGLEKEVEEGRLPSQWEAQKWPELKKRFAEIFASKTRSEWSHIFNDKDACVTPVLEPEELMDHLHNKERELLQANSTEDRVSRTNSLISPTKPLATGAYEPTPAPRLSRTPAFSVVERRQPTTPGEHSVQVLSAFGFTYDQITDFIQRGIVTQPTYTKAAL